MMMEVEPAHGITKSFVPLDWPQVLFFEECSECSIKFQRKAQVMMFRNDNFPFFSKLFPCNICLSSASGRSWLRVESHEWQPGDDKVVAGLELGTPKGAEGSSLNMGYVYRIFK